MKHSASMKQLSKLLRSFRNDGLVNIRRKDGITTTRAMHEDYASMITCAQTTGGEDYDEFVLAGIEIEADEIRGDKQDLPPLEMPRLPEFCDHAVNVELIGMDFADSVKKHAAAIRYKDSKSGQWCNHSRFDFKSNWMVIATGDTDISTRTVIVSRQRTPETGRLLNQRFDTVMLNERVFRHLTPEDLTVKIQDDKYPLELLWHCGPMQCYYIQSPRIVIE